MQSSRTRSGFTLLEVLAAVAILGIWYIILATVGIQGLSAQGQSHRRLEASFIADEFIAEIESGLSTGKAPPEGVEEFERDLYTVSVEVASYDLYVPPLDSEASTLDGSSLEAAAFEVPNLLGAGGPGTTSPLRSIRVLVTWPEGHEEKTVTRDTFGFDLDSVREELQELEGLIAEAEAEESADEAAANDPEAAGGPTPEQIEALLPR